MPQVLDINDLGAGGLVLDEPAYQLPPEVWTTALNWHFVDNGVALNKGWTQVFGTPNIAPHFAMAMNSPTQTFWLYTSLTKASVWNGNSHTDITRAVGGDYNAQETRNWNGTILGGIPILNNGNDAPQYWDALDITHRLQPITAWPATGKAARIRAFGAYLVAINYTVGGNVYPHLVKWSSEVGGPGSLPTSWDETNQAVDAGIYDLPDVESGVLREMLSLGSKMMLYKDNAIWAMRFVGGRAVFGFDTFSETIGILAPRCVSITGDGKKHVVATQDDIIIHDGNSNPVSILDKKMRKNIFSSIDPTNYINSFMFTDSENSEVIFCYPELGMTNPNKALHFNYKNGTLWQSDGITFRNAALGNIEGSETELWSDGSDPWETDTGPWTRQTRHKLLLCGTDAGKFYQWNLGYQRDGVNYSGTLQRTSLSMIGKKRTGEWIVNHEIMKFIDRLWPKVQGGPIQIRIGTQQTVGGAVVWSDYMNFDPTTMVVADFSLSGRAVAIEFFVPSSIASRVDGYRISLTADGEF